MSRELKFKEKDEVTVVSTALPFPEGTKCKVIVSCTMPGELDYQIEPLIDPLMSWWVAEEDIELTESEPEGCEQAEAMLERVIEVDPMDCPVEPVEEIERYIPEINDAIVVSDLNNDQAKYNGLEGIVVDVNLSSTPEYHTCDIVLPYGVELKVNIDRVHFIKRHGDPEKALEAMKKEKPWYVHWDNKQWTMVSDDYDHSDPMFGYQDTSHKLHCRLDQAKKAGDPVATEIIMEYLKQGGKKLIWQPMTTLEEPKITSMHINESADLPDPKKIKEVFEEVFKKDPESFTKHDQGKSRLDLLPKSAKRFIKLNSLFYVFLLQKEKPRYNGMEALGLRMLDFTSINETGKILAHGAEKYGEHNWKGVGNLGRYWGALGRHIEAMDLEGNESLDDDSGLRHAAHALTNIMFLLDLDPDLQS